MQDEQQEYAEQYSKREGFTRIGLYLALGLGFMLAFQYWMLPQFTAFVGEAHCYEWGGVSGIRWVFYTVFAMMPLVFALVSLACFPIGRRAFKEGRYPPSGMKVYRPTRINRTAFAHFRGAIMMAMPFVFSAIAVVGFISIHQLDVNLEHADMSQCTFTDTQ
uniref:hypothetical protein n=1 Tax=Thaumasiovibrio occultus TaxID=1891184 RepID=UPI000B3528F9|nr:hypothetical protein [Thaumasiovibrio occultus]